MARRIDSEAFAPYGEIYDTFGTVALNQENFTGDTPDLGVANMFHTDNRELNTSEGRWLSPDPAGQGWNQYAYVLNNPLANIDPLGLDCVTVTSNDTDNQGQHLGGIRLGDCPGIDPNNEFYFDGTVDQNNPPIVDPNTGNVVASVNGQLTCSGDSGCASINTVTSSITVNGGSALQVYIPFTPISALQQAPGGAPLGGATATISAYHPPTPSQKRAAIEAECTIESLNANNSSGAPTPAVDGTINSNSAGRNQAVIQQVNGQWPTPSAPNYVPLNPEGVKDAQFAEAIGFPPQYFVYAAKQNCLHNLGAQ
jgi:RHS repeat-associated protein